MKDEKIYRGDIYLANLNPYKGSEQGGKRPVIIIQNDVGNHYSPTVIVTAVTSRFFKKRALPTHVPLDNEELEKNSLAFTVRSAEKHSAESINGEPAKSGFAKVSVNALFILMTERYVRVSYRCSIEQYGNQTY